MRTARTTHRTGTTIPIGVFVPNRTEINAGVDVHLATPLAARSDHALLLPLHQLIEKLREHVLVDHPMLPHDRRHEFLLVLRPRMRHVDPKRRSQHIKPPSRVPQLRQKLHFVVPIVHKPLVKPRHPLRLLQNHVRLLLVLHETLHQRQRLRVVRIQPLIEVVIVQILPLSELPTRRRLQTPSQCLLCRGDLVFTPNSKGFRSVTSSDTSRICCTRACTRRPEQ